MDQRVSLITLGVDDLQRSIRFYEAMGWRGQTVDETAFFQAGSSALVLWARQKLASDAGVETAEPGPGFGAIALAQNVRSRQEVDDILAAAGQAGATITRPAAETSYGGYAGYFADPDGHLWEIAHNPGFALADDGSLVLPDFGGS
jgi:catechol 2,3-dioxygenase-like lactoylglutathione lyase family enzyme